VGRSQVRDALVLRRHPLPSGDLVVTLLSPDGKWRAIARKGRLPGGNLARLSLFHDVTLQAYWRRDDDDLPLVTQVRLNGALPGLSRPQVYGYAHLLAELCDQLTTEARGEERYYALLASGLRGLQQHSDPEVVALAYAWRLLREGGFAPRVARCERCGGVSIYLLPDEGTSRCQDCLGLDAPRALKLGEEALADLDRLQRGPLQAAIDEPARDRPAAWRALRAFARWHIGTLRSLEAMA
jgi:DNA repair protein RecO (recombination protein O)